MFLALTSNKKNWSKDDDLILLGDWCEEGNNLDGIKYNVIKNQRHDSHDKIIIKQKYIIDFYFEIIPLLSSKLNLIHDTKKSDKYWEYLIGPWLWNFLVIFHDRYSCINQAMLEYPEIHTNISFNNYFHLRYADFEQEFQSEEYNFYIFSEIIKNINSKFKINKIKLIDTHVNKIVFKKKTRNYYDTTKQNPFIQFKLFLKLIIQKGRYLQNFFFELLGSHYNNFLDLNSALSYDQKKNIYKKSNNFFYTIKITEAQILLNQNIIKDKYYNLKIREEKISIETKDKFKKLISNIIIKNMPNEYLESYLSLNDYFINRLPKKIPIDILIRSQVESNTNLRYLISLLHERGSRIISCQEGGDVGIKALSLYPEKIFSSLCDLWLTWGWGKESDKKILKFYFTKNFWIKDYKYKKNGNLLMIGGSCKNYFMSFLEGQLPIHNNQHLKYNQTFISNLNSNTFKKLLYRFHWRFGFNEDKKLLKKFPKLNCSFREDTSHFYTLLNNSKLAIITSEFTTYKQTFLVNHPTILLWDKDYFAVRDNAKKNFDELYEAKIFHYDPKECAKFVNNIQNNTMDWWKSDKVQLARKNFLLNFNKLSDNIENEFVKIIKKNN